jgi:hypothetical protein
MTQAQNLEALWERLRTALEPYRTVRFNEHGRLAMSTIARHYELKAAWRRGDLTWEEVARYFWGLLVDHFRVFGDCPVRQVEVRGSRMPVFAFEVHGAPVNRDIEGLVRCVWNDLFWFYLERYDARGFYYFRIPEELLEPSVAHDVAACIP